MREILDFGIKQLRLRHRDQTVVSFCFALFFLLQFDCANQHTIDEAAGKERVISKNQNIQRISVFGLGGRYEPKIIRNMRSPTRGSRPVGG
jgi:hypothetical protein